MVYFCADDYGVSAEANSRIEVCLEKGVLNKVSVLPNGKITDFKQILQNKNAHLSLHINLVEGRPLSPLEEIDLLVTDDGRFKHSFIGLLRLSFSFKRKKLKEQLYKEIQRQIKFWQSSFGDNIPISVDSHQHVHMIPLIFKVLMRCISDEGVSVERMRFPSEPIMPYVFTPSLYFEYTPTGLIKQWLLKLLSVANLRELKKSGIQTTYFMGVLFSGKLTEKKIKKILPKYLKLAEKNARDVEIGFHPGFIKDGEKLIEGCREDFCKFYFSPWRVAEYNTLLNLKF